jgi:alpha-galactosidase
MTKYLVAAIKQYGVDCLRIDYNLNPLPYWRALNDRDPDRVGLAEIRYVEGLYQMWDDILAARPGLFIDNCASGGMRVDLETCSRSLPLWRTDATIDPLFRQDFDQAALQNQVMTAGLSRYVPFSVSGQMGVTPYQFRSGFNAGIAFCEDCRPAGYPREMLRRAIAEGKRLRPYFAEDLYVLSEVTTDPRDWCVLQYHRPGEGDGMILAFRRQASPYGSCWCEPRGVDVGARYEVTISHGYERGKPATIQGAALAHFRAEIDDRPGSLVVEYRRRP